MGERELSRYERNLREDTERIGRILGAAGFQPAQGQSAIQLNPKDIIAGVGDEGVPPPPDLPEVERFQEAFTSSSLPFVAREREKRGLRPISSRTLGSTGALAGAFAGTPITLVRCHIYTSTRTSLSLGGGAPAASSDHHFFVVCEAERELAPFSAAKAGKLGGLRRFFGRRERAAPAAGGQVDPELEVEGDEELAHRLGAAPELQAKIKQLPESGGLELGGRLVATRAEGELGLTIGGRPHKDDDDYETRVAADLRGMIETALLARERLAF